MKNIILFIFIMSSFAEAIDPRTTLANGATNEVHDYHCICRRVSNSTGKGVMIPWRTLGEWNSFIASTAVPAITKSACTGVVPGHPPIASVSDVVSTGQCTVSTSPITISNVQNSGGYTLKFYIVSLIASGCGVVAYVNNGNGNVATGLADGWNSVSVCENSEVTVSFSCNQGPNENVEVYRSDNGYLTAFNVDFTNGNPSCL